jgi:triosephosphate isomerase
MLIINFKNYERVAFHNGESVLAEVCDYLLENPEINNKVYFAPNLLDLGFYVDRFPGLNFIAQHVDPKKGEKTTGWITFRSLERLGVERVLLNHSEHRFSDLNNLVDKANELTDEGFDVITCCEDLSEAKFIRDKANVHAVALESPELIGTGRSISNERPEEVKKFVDEFKSVPELTVVGAGVSTQEDVIQGIGLGAEGFILASAFVKAENHLEKLKEFLYPLS